MTNYRGWGRTAMRPAAVPALMVVFISLSNSLGVIVIYRIIVYLLGV